METNLSFDIGTYSTKVTFNSSSAPLALTTLEFPNAILFLHSESSFKVIVGEKALHLLRKDREKNASSFVASFSNLLTKTKKHCRMSGDELFTFAILKETKQHPLLFMINNIKALISPEKCLFYFLQKITNKIKKKYFSGNEVGFSAKVVFDGRSCWVERKKIRQIMNDIGMKKVEFCHKAIALGLLYIKQNRLQLERRVLFVDVGYSFSAFYIVDVGPKGVRVLKERTIPNLGVRNMDHEIHLQILADLHHKYKIDYQHDRMTRFKVMDIFETMRKTFEANAEIKLDIADIFGEEYKDQFAVVNKEVYYDRSERHLDCFTDQFVRFWNEFGGDEELGDVQIVGGGQKLEIFQDIVKRHVQFEGEINKMSHNYSTSRGAMLIEDFEGDLEFNNTEGIHYEILELKENKEENEEEDKEEDKNDENAEEKISEESDKPNNEDSQQTLKVQQPIWHKRDEDRSVSVNRIITSPLQTDPYFDLKVCTGDSLYPENTLLNVTSNKKQIAFPSDPSKTYLLHIFTFGKNQQTNSLFKQELIKPFNSVYLNMPSSFTFVDIKTEPGSLEITPIDNSPTENDTGIEDLPISEDGTENNSNERQEIVVQIHNHSHHSHSNCHSEENNRALKKNPLINATFLHVVADFIQGIFLLLLAILIHFKPSFEILDPLVSIIISLLIIFLAGRYTLRLFVRLMDATPPQIDYQQVLKQLAELVGVKEVHDLHIWDLGDRKFAGTAHLVCVGEQREVLRDATLVFRKHEIFHTTIQIEDPMSKNDSLYIDCGNNVD